MLKPIRLFADSLKQFAIGLGPAIAMAFVCLAFQLALWTTVGDVREAIFPSPPPPAIDSPEFLELLGRNDWHDQARELIGYTLGNSILFFFHALVAVTLTAWLLRGRAGFQPGRVLRRALGGAGLLTCAAAVVFAAAFALKDMLPATRDIRFDFGAAAMIALWFGATALLLPARLMGYRPAAGSGFLKTTLLAAIVLVPWFYASEVVGAPLRHCRDCGGLFDGGIVFYSVLGAYLLGLTVSSAAVSAAACRPPRESQMPTPAALPPAAAATR